MDVVDGMFDVLVDFPGDGSSDGLVQGPSQYYPGSGAIQYPIHHADSHSAALRSPLDHPVIYDALANQFHVPTVANCSFSTPPSSQNFASSGGAGTVDVTTLAGCKWSAVSMGYPMARYRSR